MLAYTAAFQALAAVGLLPTAITHFTTIEIKWSTACGLFASSLFWLAFSAFAFRAARRTDAAVTAVFGRMRILFVAVMGWCFLGEQINSMRAIGISCVLFGTVILAVKEIRKPSAGGVWDTMIAALAISCAFAVDKCLTRTVPPSVIAFCGFGLSGAWVALVSRERLMHRLVTLMQECWRIVVLAVITSVVSYWTLLRAFQSGELTQVVPIYQCSVIITVLLAAVVLNERTQMWRRVIASLLVAMGGVIVKLS